jgi:hypothetical protein
VFLFYASVRTGRVGSWVAFSLIGCVSALTEPVLLPPMALTGLLILLWPTLTPVARLRNAGILLACALIVIGPWTIRNRLVHGAWVPVKSTFWVNVWKGNNDYATGTDRLTITAAQLAKLRGTSLADADLVARDPAFDGVRQYDMLTPEQRQCLWGKPDAAREAVFKEWAVEWIRSHPSRYFQLCGLRLVKTVWLDWDNPKSRNVPYVVSRTILVALSVIGLVIALRRKWSLFYPAMVAALCLAVYTLTVTAARFSIPFEPLQFCLAALAVVSIASRGNTPDTLVMDKSRPVSALQESNVT